MELLHHFRSSKVVPSSALRTRPELSCQVSDGKKWFPDYKETEFKNLKLFDYPDEWWQGKLVLDAGANVNTTLAKYIEAKGARVVSLSLDWKGAHPANDELRVQADMVELPFADKQFDLIVCSKSIPYYSRDQRVFQRQIEELIRVARNGGEIRITPCLPYFYNNRYGGGVRHPVLAIIQAARRIDTAISMEFISETGSFPIAKIKKEEGDFGKSLGLEKIPKKQLLIELSNILRCVLSKKQS